MDDPATAGRLSLGTVRPRYLLPRSRRVATEKEFHEATGWLAFAKSSRLPQSPWQNPYVERLIGTIRRDAGPVIV